MACRGARAGVARRVPRGSRLGAGPAGSARATLLADRAAGDRDPGDRGGDARLRWVWHLGAHCTGGCAGAVGDPVPHSRARRRFGRCCRGWTPPIWTGGWVPTSRRTSRGPTPVSWFRSPSTARPCEERCAPGQRPPHLVSVFAHRARLVLGQFAVAEKSNEIPCVRKLLKLLPRRVRWLVTVDAMHTQVATANLICTTVKSHYLMVVKANQAGLLARITALPWANGGAVSRHVPCRSSPPQGVSAFPTPNRSSGSPANASSRPPANAASRSSTPFAACRSSKPGQRNSHLAAPAWGYRELPALGARRHLRRRSIHHPHRQRRPDHGVPAQHRDQPAAPPTPPRPAAPPR